jgi:hypothetical protein
MLWLPSGGTLVGTVGKLILKCPVGEVKPIQSVVCAVEFDGVKSAAGRA